MAIPNTTSWSTLAHLRQHTFWITTFPTIIESGRKSKSFMGGRDMVWFLTIHCTTLGLGGYLGVRPSPSAKNPAVLAKKKSDIARLEQRWETYQKKNSPTKSPPKTVFQCFLFESLTLLQLRSSKQLTWQNMQIFHSNKPCKYQTILQSGVKKFVPPKNSPKTRPFGTCRPWGSGPNGRWIQKFWWIFSVVNFSSKHLWVFFLNFQVKLHLKLLFFT